MEKMIVRLLEISRQLEEDIGGEFDFENLKSVLAEFEKQASTILKIKQEHKVLKNNLILRVMGKLRVLKNSQINGSYSVWEELITGNPDLRVEKLLDIYARLAEELNTVLSTRPNFRKANVVPDEKPVGDEFKIGG